MEDESLLELGRILDRDKDPTDLPLALLKGITNNFSKERKIGGGGFGAVYKGVFREQGIFLERVVAVKRIYVNLERIDDDDKQFGREVKSLWNTNHPNVVRFLGFCSNIHQKQITKDGEINLANERERLFCFEYISNGSLNKHITDELRGFEWETRYGIITGICEGLHYLHEEKKFIHMDLKPANVLLDHQDGKYIPKITDFGLSRPNENSHTVGNVYGTLGYWAPENRDGSKTTPACDIYSLGAIIRELVTGCMEVPNKDNVLRRWRHRWRKPPTLLQYQEITRCIEIARSCREPKPEDRPSIKKIIECLTVSTDGHIGQISPCLYEDDMLGIKPLVLQLPSELKEDKSFSVELKNDTANRMAFNIKLQSSERYSAQPDKGIVQPGSKYDVNITVHPQDMHHGDKLTVQSMKDSEGLRDEDVTKQMFEEAGKVLDEVDLMVVCEPTKPQENCKRREDTNMLAEKEPKAKQRKIVESTSVKGKHDSSENVEAPSMDINSGTQGQCAQQTEQCKLLPLKSFSCHYPTNTKYLGKESRAVDRARGTMGSLLDKLGKLVTQDYNLQTSMKKDIDSFSKDLKNIHRELPKLENVDGAEDFVEEVRELSYNVEDIVDSFLVRVEPNFNGIGFRELTHEGLKLWENGMRTHHHIGDVIRDIKNQVQVVVDRKKDSFNVNSFVPNATDKAAIEDLRISAINIGIEQLIGIEAPRDEIIDLFEEDGNISKQNLRIVSIVGLGGLGKTTLAKAVYEKLSKANNYTRAFVPVGQNPVVKEVLKNIISAFENGFNAEKLQVWQLREKLQNLLENKRYFIFIDDIWDPSDWEDIKSAFPENECASRVITTTRNHDVALACCNSVIKYVYTLKRLSEEDSERLFCRRAFGAEKDCPDTLKDILVDILKTCGGMPLAINSIASLLRGKEYTTWERVWKSLGALTVGKTALEKMKQILDLSYLHLPDYLKTCLLYVCKYSEDQEIDKNDLLRQWVAEGFVHVGTNSRLDAEDVAEDYFQKLISMCMLQPGNVDYYSNEVLSCRVHDIILDLMRSKSTEVNFHHVIDGSKHVTEARGKIRRVSVHFNYEKDMRILETLKNKGLLEHVRSVFLNEGSLLPYFLEFKYVRVLHLESRGYFNDLDLTGINRLFLLRYLKVTCYPYKRLNLPGQIGNLQQLETISIISDLPKLADGGIEIFPSDIISLPRLSHLSCGSGIVLPDGIDRLKSLRTLEGVCLAESTVENIKALGELTNLTKLQFYWPCDSPSELGSACMDALHSSISKLSASLKILIFENDEVGNVLEVPSWSRALFRPRSHIRVLNLSALHFESYPEWIGQLHHLYSLSIKVREVADGFTIVGGLPSLAYFCLHVYVKYGEEEKEESVVISGGGAFKALKHLEFHCQHATLTFERGALPVLEKLELLFSSILIRGYIPVGIEHLPAPTLKQICLIVGPGDEKHWKVKGSQKWSEWDWDSYFRSDHYKDRRIKYDRKSRTVWKRAFKKHQPNADIYIYFAKSDLPYDDNYAGLSCVDDGYYRDEDDDKENLFKSDYFIKLGRLHEEEDDSEEHNEDAYHDEDYHKEDYYSEEDDEGVDNSDENNEADRGAPQGNGSETPAQAQANTRQLVELMEVQEDSGRVSINTDAPLMVHTSVDLAVGSERWQGRRGSQDLSVLEYSQLPFTGLLAPLPPSLPPITWPDRAKPVANFPVDINNNLLVEHGNAGMLVNVMGQYLHLNQASTGRLVDLNRAYLAVLESSQLPSTSLLAPLPPSHPPFTWPETAEPVARFPVDISNDLLVQQGHNDLLVQQGHNDLLVQQGNICMLINAVAQYLDLNQAPTGVLVDLNHAYLAVLESLQLPFTSDLIAPNQLTDEEFLELSEYPYVNQAPPGGLAELNQAPNQLIDEEFLELSADI